LTVKRIGRSDGFRGRGSVSWTGRMRICNLSKGVRGESDVLKGPGLGSEGEVQPKTDKAQAGPRSGGGRGVPLERGESGHS